MSDKRLLDTERVARAIFLPAMLDSNGKVSLAAFTLRHNEGYFSVARMAVEGWLDDLKRIPSSATRQLGGYCKMGVGDVRNLGFTYSEKNEVPFGVSATGLLLMIQTKLSQLAGQSYMSMTTEKETKYNR